MSSGATATSEPGIYPIGLGSLSASRNYQITYVGADLNIGPYVHLDFLPEQIAQLVEGYELPYVADNPATPDQRQAIEKSVTPVVLIGTVVDAKPVARQLPVHENVTTNGDSGQWQPPATGR